MQVNETLNKSEHLRCSYFSGVAYSNLDYLLHFFPLLYLIYTLELKQPHWFMSLGLDADGFFVLFCFCPSRRTESSSSRIDTKTWRRTTSWSDTEPGAAPPSQNKLCVGSAGSGSSAWPDGRASQPACWTQSGTISHIFLLHLSYKTKNCNLASGAKLTVFLTHSNPPCGSHCKV